MKSKQTRTLPPVMQHPVDLSSPGPEETSEEPFVVPIEDSIDLHAFQPREVKHLLDDYLEAACAKGFGEVRIIHGKGSGILKAKVRSILSGHPLVQSFREAEQHHGGWGATQVVLKCEETAAAQSQPKVERL